MPRRRQPRTLFKLSLDVSINIFLNEWSTNSGSCSAYLDEYFFVPPSVLDVLINRIVEKYVSIKRRIPLDTGSLSELLGTILTNRLRHLNLKPLMHHESVADSELCRFENMLLRTIPYMNNLVLISLKTCGDRINTLPVCSDMLMKEIGACCPKLKDLDISNTHVTDMGLAYLIPTPDHCGCPSLKKLFLFECYATVDGVAHLLLNLPNIMFLGFKETGLAVLKLHNDKCNTQLSLTHLNNIGCPSSSCWDMNRLIYSTKLSQIICKMVPYLTELKVRVLDHMMRFLVLGPNVVTLNLFFGLENIAPTGKSFIHLLSTYGHQLSALSLYCSTICVSHIMTIGESCKNLQVFTLKCNHITDNYQLYHRNLSNFGSHFLNLENLYVKVKHSSIPSYNSEHFSDTVLKCLSFIVFSTKALKDFYLCFNCDIITDAWVKQFINLINTNTLETFMIEVPNLHEFSTGTLNLTMTSVEHVLMSCPNLETIGNLYVWCVSVEELKELCRQRRLNNHQLNIIYRQLEFDNNR